MWLPKCLQEIVDHLGPGKKIRKQFQDTIDYQNRVIKDVRSELKEFQGFKDGIMKCGHHVSNLFDDQCGRPEHKICGQCEDKNEIDSLQEQVDELEKELERLRPIVTKYLREHPDEGLEI
jgi:hypothetical protein